MAHPPRLTLAGLLLGFLLFVAPSGANKCRSGCHGIHSSKAYQEGHTYTYELEGESVTSVSEAQGEATLKLNALVELSIKPDCVHQIRLKNVRINGAPASQSEIERHGVQFNYHNGHIDTEICTEAGETQAALNVKRAVISLFQDAIIQDDGSTTHHETDVFGSCPTDFTFSTSGESRTIKKHRNLEECLYRENIRQDLMSASIDPNSGFKTTPLLASEQEVEQQFNRGILNKVKSVETYKLKPFSNGEAGARTVVETTLTFKGKKGDSPPAPVSEPKSLVFEVPHPVVSSSIDAIERVLHNVHESMPDDVTSSGAHQFTELIKVLRRSSKNDILTAYSRVRAGAGFENNAAKKVFLDALFRTGTGDSVEAAAELVKTKQLDTLETIVYYTSLAFVRHASLSSVTRVTSLLNNPELPRIGYLGIGSVIGKYCQEHDCENKPEINAALAAFSSKLTKATTRQQENVVISVLKGLGNARYLDHATMTKIASIAVDKTVHNRVRVAAIEALPAKCSMDWKKLLFSTLADRSEDSEIRIKIYLSLVACPCSHVAHTIKEVLDKETVNQVGSFIQSHLRNLRASTNPEKERAKRELGLIKPRTRFPEDFRKFSYNDELSYSIDALGLGSAAESNVIYSQNSFFPRSASINLTSEVFGRYFNFLEIDGRFENVDVLLEKYLGPKGILRPSNLKDVLLDGRKSYDNIVKKVIDRYEKKVGRRHARDVSQNQIVNFGRKIHLPETELDDDLELDLSIKLFGAELVFLSYQGNDKFNPNSIVDQILNALEDGADKAKHFNYNIKNHLNFLDAELVYPTGLGLPLSLGVVGTSVVHLKTSGKIDIIEIIKNPKSTAIEIAVEPSASIEIGGSLIVEGFGVESGLKVITSLHTSTATDVSVKLLDGYGVDVNIGLPKQKQELINIESKVLISSGPKGDNYVPPKFSNGQEHSDCFDQLYSLAGLTVCGKIAYPYDSLAAVQKKPLFPLSGPASFALRTENNDVKSYHFRAYYDTKNPKARSLEILLETPNTRTERKISLLLEAAVEPDKLVRVTFDSPFKKAVVEGIIKNTQKEQTLAVTVRHDSIEYYARIGVESSGNRYRPILEYKVPEHIEKLAGIKNGVKNTRRDGQHYSVGGVVDVSDYNGGKKYVFNQLSLVSEGQSILNIDGTVAVSRQGGNADLKIGYGGDRLLLKGNSVVSNIFTQKTQISVASTKKPENSFSVTFETDGDAKHYKETVVFVHGSDLNSQTNRITYHADNKYEYVNANKFDISFGRKLTYPAVGLVAKLETGATPKSIEYEFEFKYDKFNIESELSANVGKPGDFEAEFEAKLQGNSIKLKTERAVLGEHKSKFETSLEVHPGGKYEIEAVIDHDDKSNDINTKIVAQIKVNGKKAVIDVGLEANQNRVNSNAVIDYESTRYLDFLLALQRGTNPNGNLKLNLKNYVTANGQFKFVKGAGGDADIEINIPKFSRKITGHGKVAITGSRHVANVDISYDASKDPKKRIKLSSDSDLTSTSFDTKNTIEILDYKTVVNAKGNRQGRHDNGHQDFEFDVTFPCGRYVVGKGSRDATTKNELIDGKMQFELIDHVNKGGKRRDLVYHAEVHDLNLVAYTYRAKHDLKFIDFERKDINVLLELKNLHNGPDKKSRDLKFNLLGAKIPSPFSLEYSHDSEKDGASGSGKFKSTLGNNLSLQVNGNLVRGNGVDKPTAVEAAFEIKLPSQKLSNVKLEYSGTILTPNEPTGRFEYIERTELTYNTDQTIKLDSRFTNVGIFVYDHTFEGSGKATLTVLSNAPITVGYSYKHNPTNELKETSGSLSINNGNKQTNIAVDSTYLEHLNVINLNIKATTPVETIRNVDIKFQHEGTDRIGRHPIPSSSKTNIIAIVNQAKYTLEQEMAVKEDKVSGSVTVTTPQGVTKHTIVFNKLGTNKFSGEWKLSTPKGFVNIDGEIDVAKIDDFSIIFNFDSDKVQTRKIHGEIANNKVAKGGKKIVINISSEGKNIILGSTSYNKHSEGSKVIVEGNGSLKIRDSTKSSSFKYTHQQLTSDVNGELGVTSLLTFNFGPSSIVNEFKFTDKEVYVFNSYCEQSADCAQFKLQAKSSQSGLKRSKESTLEVDLRKFNVPYEFGLKSNQVIDPQSGYDDSTSLYLHSSKGKTEYSYQAYLHPTESGVILTLPSRELALIGTANLPKNKRSGGYKIDTSLYLDRKRSPKEKTSLTITGDVLFEKSTVSITGESRLTYPSQHKDLSVKGKLHVGGAHLLDANFDIDVFAKRNQKITVVAKVLQTPINDNTGYNVTGSLSVTSPGQRLKVDVDEYVTISRKEIAFGSFLAYTDEHQKPKSTGVEFYVNLQGVHLLIKSPDQELIKVDSKLDLSKNIQKIDTDIAIFNRAPVIITLEVRDMNSFKYLAYERNNPNNKFEAGGRVVVGQIAELHADSVKDGAKKELFRIRIQLDERHYLKPEFSFDKNNIGHVIDSYRGRVVEVAKLTNEFVESLAEEIITEVKDLLEHLKKAQPNLKPLFDYYVAELTKLKDELNIETEGIKQIQAKLNEVFGGTIQLVLEIVKQVTHRFEELQKIFRETVDRLGVAFKATLPEFQKIWRAISNLIIDLFEDAAKTLANILKTFADIFNANKDEFKQVAILFAELTNEITSIIIKTATQIKKDANDFYTVLIKEFKALPIYEFVKQKYGELSDVKIYEGLIRAITDVVQSVKKFLPTKELQNLLTATYDYIIKLVKREKVDDVQEIKKLYALILHAIESVIELVKSRTVKNDFSNVIETKLPFDLSALSKLPGIVTLKLSVLTLLRNQEFPTLNEVLNTYRPTKYPSDLIPPFGKFATFAESSFFSFDGRGVALPGQCSYVLAQDARDGNFSIVAQLQNGKLTGVTIAEPTESITIESTGRILVNNQPADFPASTKNLRASLHYPRVRVVSEYGITLDCDTGSGLICSVHVSGFYHGRLRGLLGNANNEPWDDFTLPSGKVTENPSEFGNAFKLTPGCADVSPADLRAPKHESFCTDFFTGSSSLSPCFDHINPSQYRDYCDLLAGNVATSELKRSYACYFARAYVLNCQYKNIPVHIPSSCASCQVGNRKVDIGDTFSTQHPKQQADVVIVVEQATENIKVFNELVLPLISFVRTELKEQGITDVHVGLIGFGDHMDTPEHYTLKGSRNIDGDQVKNMKFASRTPTITLEEAKAGDGKKKLDYFGQMLVNELGTFKLTDAYQEALNYDFRPGASKTVIGVIATPCLKSPLPVSLQQLRLLLGLVAYNEMGMTYHEIANLDDILISGKPDKSVVGFDSDSVFTFADNKKKPVEGSTELKNNMVLASRDVCATFAADSGGGAYSAHNFLEAKENKKKQFKQVVARRIVSSLVGTEIREDCVCKQGYGGFAKTECKIISRKEKEPIARRTKTGRKG
ncbi:apolipophorins [Neodiprion pinetum]|uniref:apolipophorins n=1 Tax=Neodiprion pinetum TaxID=441929 RepID=UPI001EDD7642|nr:apolipophorins [Neodiprion pinetum]